VLKLANAAAERGLLEQLAGSSRDRRPLQHIEDVADRRPMLDYEEAYLSIWRLDP
jgi:hypothetical protein